jgi:hypothetical protein
MSATLPHGNQELAVSCGWLAAICGEAGAAPQYRGITRLAVWGQRVQGNIFAHALV